MHFTTVCSHAKHDSQLSFRMEVDNTTFTFINDVKCERFYEFFIKSLGNTKAVICKIMFCTC